MKRTHTFIGIGIVTGILATAIVARHVRPARSPAAALSALSAAAPADTASSCDGAEACGGHAPGAGVVPAARIEGRPRLVVFSSASCPACKRMEPVLSRAVKACHGEEEIYHVDFDDDAGEAIAATYGVTLLPSFVSIDASGSEVARLTGVQAQAPLERAIEEIRGARCASLEAVSDEAPM